MRWIDIYEVAIALEEKYPDLDIMNLNFVYLREIVLTLEGFEDEVNKSNEKILEAIQMAWIEERGL